VGQHILFDTEKDMSGWPSGLRCQTEGYISSEIECLDPRMSACVRIPLLSEYFLLIFMGYEQYVLAMFHFINICYYQWKIILYFQSINNI